LLQRRRQTGRKTPPPDRAQTFTRACTRKEAYLKGVGVCLADGVGAEYVGTYDGAPGPAGWTICDVPVPAGYIAAVALRCR
jgi:4'-phosphopantetheinyl transferase